MKLSILLRTSDYRGDHAADVQVAYDAVKGETVEDLVNRIGESRRHRWPHHSPEQATAALYEEFGKLATGNRPKGFRPPGR